MNRYLKRVFAAYLLSVLTVFIYAPWQGPGWETLRYGFIWDPPGHLHLIFIDYRRIFLEVTTLTLVLLLATISLWGTSDE